MYIGSSTNIGGRKDKHFSLLRHGKHLNHRLQAAVYELGIENFRLMILEFVSDLSQLVEREQYYIDLYQPVYNIYEDTTKQVVPLEVRRRMSEGKKRRFAEGTLQPNGAKAIVQLTLDDEFVQEYRSLRQASLTTETDKGCIRKVINGVYAQMKGYRWMWKRDYEDLVKSRELLGTPEMGNQQPSVLETVRRFND